jgi:hypothetical protein
MGDLTRAEGERLIFRKRRNVEAERTTGVRYAVHQNYPRI